MREILFRGQKENGEWLYGDLVHYGDKILIFSENAQNSPDYYEVKSETVGQFTGREDAYINGTEVYEGDIIENCDTQALQIVYWNEDEAAWYCRYVEDEKRIVSLSDSLGNLNKVVGNIHENKELLK